MDRIVAPDQQPEDDFESTLRPKALADYVGQDKVKANLKILIEAAKQRDEALDHILFYGPPGLGKTTIANIVANEMGVNFKITSGPAIAIPGDLASTLTGMQKGDILFVDEIHRLSRFVEEALYPAMEDFAWDMVLGKGVAARTIRLKLQRFTIVGATTRHAMLSAPLRDRFGATFRLDYYDVEATNLIVRRSARILRVPIDDEGAWEISRRSRGTPRVANRLLKRVRDFAQVRAAGKIDQSVAQEALALLEVDELGLDDIDRRVLDTIVKKYEGGPVGVETMAASIGEEVDTIMDVCEPYLIQLGFIKRTPRGRVATPHAYRHLGLTPPESGSDQLTLF
ncbi:MAG: Holliday junction branch migration DNA helicase RuvB [Chloroflexi bacterium]|nr:Holliday junction branch migration DNA helicase RuvB [Chloroflexota bacterium]